MNRPGLVALCAVLGCLLHSSAVSSTDIRWSSIDGGGQIRPPPSTSGPSHVNGSIGQFDASPNLLPGGSIQGGFWASGDATIFADGFEQGSEP